MRLRTGQGGRCGAVAECVGPALLPLVRRPSRTTPAGLPPGLFDTLVENSRTDQVLRFEHHTIRGQAKKQTQVTLALIVILAMTPVRIRANQEDLMRPMTASARRTARACPRRSMPCETGRAAGRGPASETHPPKPDLRARVPDSKPVRRWPPKPRIKPGRRSPARRAPPRAGPAGPPSGFRQPLQRACVRPARKEGGSGRMPTVREGGGRGTRR